MTLRVIWINPHHPDPEAVAAAVMEDTNALDALFSRFWRFRDNRDYLDNRRANQ